MARVPDRVVLSALAPAKQPQPKRWAAKQEQNKTTSHTPGLGRFEGVSHARAPEPVKVQVDRGPLGNVIRNADRRRRRIRKWAHLTPGQLAAGRKLHRDFARVETQEATP